MSEIPASCHILLLAGVRFYIDSEVRKEVESFLRDANETDSPLATLLVETIAGEELTIMANALSVIYSTSPESRDIERRFDKLLESESIV